MIWMVFRKKNFFFNPQLKTSLFGPKKTFWVCARWQLKKRVSLLFLCVVKKTEKHFFPGGSYLVV